MRLLGLNTIYALLCLCFRPSTPASSEPAMQPWKYAGVLRARTPDRSPNKLCTAPHRTRSDTATTGPRGSVALARRVDA